MHNRSILAQLLLVFVTLLWGSTFLTLQIALTWADPVVIVALRFVIATGILTCLLRGEILKISRYEWKAGIVVGICIFGVYTLQTIGLQSIASSTSAFLTGLYVGVWGVINLMEGYGGDNPASKSQGVKQLMAGGGVILLGLKVVPLLSGLLG